jgi:predicted protein tyrosine phosphatase
VIGDMISPFKAVIGDAYKAVEYRLLAAIHLRFGLPPALPGDLVALIKASDRAAAYLEATRLAGFSTTEARKFFGPPPKFSTLIERNYLAPWPAETAERRYLERFAKLVGPSRFRAKISHHIRAHEHATATPMIHVCSLSRLHETVEGTGALHVVTLLKDTDRVQRPRSIEPANHLILGLDDISMPMDGYIAPADDHVRRLLDFVRGWDRAKPMVVHCYAGISRSTAGAYVAACALNPRRDELTIARELRRASATATPNPLIVSLADRMLGRDGRMAAAIDAIGRGEMAYEAEPFRLDLE